MTPTDALIEKMARAMHRAELGLAGASDEAIEWSWGRGFQDRWRLLARAAYEAEHEETKG